MTSVAQDEIFRISKMDEASGGSSHTSDQIVYKCHPLQRVKTLVCIICDNVYHLNDFAGLNKAVKLSAALGICPEHESINLNSKISTKTLSNDAKIIIAQIKTYERNEARKQILKEFQQYLNEDELATLDGNLKRENELLRELNKELHEKNTLLRVILDKQENDARSVKTKTFAMALSSTSYNNKPKRVPKIIINKISEDENIEKVNELVSHYLIEDRTIQTNKVVKKKDELVINCLNEESVDKAHKLLKAKLSDICEINQEPVVNPKLKVVGIDNFEEMDDSNIEDDINLRNFSNFKRKCVILNSYKNSKTNLLTVILETPAEIYQSVKENNNRLFVGYQKCRVYDYVNIKPCHNCGRFGHKDSKCKNNIVCLKCAGKHKTSECQVNNLKCTNCDFRNTKYNTKLKTDHIATDSHKCEILQNKIKKYIDGTDYNIKPTLPRYVGIIPTGPDKRMVKITPGISANSQLPNNTHIQDQPISDRLRNRN